MTIAKRGSVRSRNISSAPPELSRKKNKLKGSYYLAPKTELQTDNGKAIDSVVDSFSSLPILYNEDDPVVPSSKSKPPAKAKTLERDKAIIRESDSSFRSTNAVLASDPRLVNQPSQTMYSGIMREISRLLYYPGIDRASVSRLGALLIIKAKLSEAQLAAEVRNVPYPHDKKLNTKINDEIENITNSINLLSSREVLQRISTMESGITARAVTMRQSVKAQAREKELYPELQNRINELLAQRSRNPGNPWHN